MALTSDQAAELHYAKVQQVQRENDDLKLLAYWLVRILEKKYGYNIKDLERKHPWLKEE